MKKEFNPLLQPVSLAIGIGTSSGINEGTDEPGPNPENPPVDPFAGD